MPLIRVQLFDWNEYVELQRRLGEATTFEQLKDATIALLNHLQKIEYLGEADE